MSCLPFVMAVMKKIINGLIQSNVYFQVAFCALNRFFKIILNGWLLSLLIAIVILCQGAVFLKNVPLMGLQALYLWCIGGMAKPSLMLPSCGSLVTPLGIGFYCSLIVLLYSMSNSSLYGVGLSFLMILLMFFLMNAAFTATSSEKNIMRAFLNVGLFIWHEPLSVIVCFLLCIASLMLYSLSHALSLCLVGYLLVFTQLIMVKSLCTNNDVYYHQGS
jgi:hypothetical protein